MWSTLCRGVVGVGSAVGSVWFTVSGFETGIRIAGGLGGLVLLCLTIVSAWRKMPPPRRPSAFLPPDVEGIDSDDE